MSTGVIIGLLAEIRHEPWPLHSASASHVDTSLVEEAGYEPSGVLHTFSIRPGLMSRHTSHDV